MNRLYLSADRCRHCGVRRPNRPRGLCWTCYYEVEDGGALLRDRYPSTSKFARRGVGHGYQAKLPAAPTDTLPGTPEKVAILQERASRREALWHPQDAHWGDQDRPAHKANYGRPVKRVA